MTALFFLITCIAIGISLQLIFPSFLRRDILLKNMGANLGLGLVSYLCVGYIGQRAVLYQSTWGYQTKFGVFYLLELPFWAQACFGILALDLTSFLWHWANHRFSFLWKFHLVHHTDLVFETSTAFRFHPVEVFLSVGARSLTVVLLGIPVEVLAIFESTYLFFNVLEHSNIFVPLAWRRPLHLLFITPAIHIIHHSHRPEEYNSNFGTIFSLWDRLFNTLREKGTEAPPRFGLVSEERPLNTLKLLSLPFKKLRIP